MTDGAIQLDLLNPQNLQVLDAYSVRAATAKATQEEFDGWLERISSLAGFTAEALTQIHGQLIAGGYLKFEIGNSTVGLRYQISPRGRQAHEQAKAKQAEGGDAQAA